MIVTTAIQTQPPLLVPVAVKMTEWQDASLWCAVAKGACRVCANALGFNEGRARLRRNEGEWGVKATAGRG